MSAISVLGQSIAGGGGGLSVAISAGPFNQAGYGSGHTFPVNTAVPTGGVSPYTYQWQETDDNRGDWTTGTGPTFAPHATSVAVISNATYTCKVTDNVGNTAISNSAAYSYVNVSGIGPIP